MRTLSYALMVVAWLTVVAIGAQYLGDSIDRTFTATAERIQRSN